MHRIAKRPLWVGHVGDLRDPRDLHSAGIEAIVEVADNEPFASLTRDLVRLRFPLSDNGDNPDWLLRLAVNSVAALIKADIQTLVCCSGGMNRSVCVAAAGLAIAEGLPFDDALLTVVKLGPSDVSLGLLVQLRAVVGR